MSGSARCAPAARAADGTVPEGDGAEVPQCIVGRRVELTRRNLLGFCAINVLAVDYPIWRADTLSREWQRMDAENRHRPRSIESG